MMTAKLFPNGRSQAVRLPMEFRFTGTEVFIRRDEASGDVILSSKPNDWRSFIEAAQEIKPEDVQGFLESEEREPVFEARDLFAGWDE